MNVLRSLTTQGATDDTALANLFQQLLDAWNHGDGAAYGALFAEDADYVTFDGTHVKGRQHIAATHQHLFETWLKGTRLTGQIEHMRFLSPDVALLHATGGILMGKQAKVRPGRFSIQTLIATKHNDTWHFTAFHNNRVQRRNTVQNIMFGVATRVLHR